MIKQMPSSVGIQYMYLYSYLNISRREGFKQMAGGEIFLYDSVNTYISVNIGEYCWLGNIPI